MGRIFTWAQIENKSVPKLESFSKVADCLYQSLNDCPYVYGGLIYGSFAHGYHNIRSDIDCLIVCHNGQKNSVSHWLESTKEYAEKLHVPLKPEICEEIIGRSNFPTAGQGLRKHLQQFTSQGIKVSPLNLLDKVIVPFDEMFYMQRKLEELDRGAKKFSRMTETERCIFLQKMIEAPIHCARKVLIWRDIPIGNDSKDTVVRLYRQHMPPDDAQILDSVYDLDQAYTELVLEQLKTPNYGLYASAINEITRLIPAVRNFVWINSTNVK